MGGVDLELRAVTDEGSRLAELARAHAEAFARRADEHDRAGTFPFESWEEMKESGFLAASVPAEFGGLGVSSVHDLALATSRLARGDASTAIAANMHLVTPWFFTRLYEHARSTGDTRTERRLTHLLRTAGASRVICCVAFTEAGTFPSWPAAEATRDDGGYRINGHKIFCTNAPASTLFVSTVRVAARDGEYALGLAAVPRATPGLEVRETWDALGMRASGSHDVVYEDCFVPEEMVTLAGPLGDFAADGFPLLLVNTITLAGASLGIAEAAHAVAVDLVRTRRKAPSNRLLAERLAVQTRVAESEVDLAASRAILARSALRLDEHFAAHGQDELELDELHQLMKDVQCTSMAVKHKAIAIVDRAMTLSGGSGYLSRSPLSRLYRDVRAGPFMQPFSPLEAFEYIGKVALGLEPTLDV